MPTSSVRAVLAAALSIWASVIAAQQPIGGQPRRVSFGLAVGATVPTGHAVDVPGDIGPHLQLSSSWQRSARFAWRGNLLAEMLSGAGVEPSCVPGSACRGFAIHPDQVYSGTVSAEFRPLAAAPRVFGLAGGGVYYARGPEATDFGASFGALGGVGLDLARAGHAGFSLEAKYQRTLPPLI
jgi:hypothetical protein